MAKELNKIQAKAQKKKITILAVMVLFTAFTWSKTLLGKDDKKSAPVASATSAGGPQAPSGLPTAPAAITVVRTAITSYEQAVARMDLWPVALERQVHSGIIAELSPINPLLASEEDFEEEELPPLDDYLMAPPALEGLPPEEPEVLFEDLRLKLTTTALFGKTAFAIINGEKVSIGQTVEVQVDGQTVRYEVRAIGSRMVELAYEGQPHVLRIGLPGLAGQDQDGA